MSLYTCCSLEQLEPSLQTHLHSPTAQHAEIIKRGCFDMYRFQSRGSFHEGGGLLNAIKDRFHPHFETSKSKRHGRTLIKGSSKKTGKTVDTQIARLIENPKLKRPHKWTKAIHQQLIVILGHSYQAAQVPVELTPHWPGRMTQADLITKDKNGKLWLWEIKTGMPVSFRKQRASKGKKKKCFLNIQPEVECSPLGVWNLQACFTESALKHAGVQIYQTRIIQVYDRRNSKTGKLEIFCEIHEPEQWARKAARLVG